MNYRFLGHTSEAKFQAFGKTLEDVFASAGHALTALMVDEPVPIEKKELSVKGDSVESLLYDFLNEVIYLKDVGFVVGDFRNLSITKKHGTYRLQAEAWGDSIEQYDTKADVKAPTYHDMKVEKRDRDWVAQVVVDV